MDDLNAQIIEELRSNGGAVAGNFEGMALVILTTTGAKSGAKRENPVASPASDDTIYVFSSAAGSPSDPVFYRKLVATPSAHVEMGTDSFDAEAIVVELRR
jgi:deazaflavin-dependent oxidoreductase (nitroreductase family)